MAGRVSKNQRSATPVGGSKTMQIVGDIRLITPLNHGKHARIYNVTTGKNPHVSVNSDAFDTQIRELATAGLGAKLLAELERLHAQFPTHGWDKTAARAAAVLSADPVDTV